MTDTDTGTQTPNEIVRRDTMDLVQLAAALNDRRTRSLDIVAPASAVRFDGAALVISGMDQTIGEDGVTDPNGRYVPTVVGHETLGARLDIPARYLKRLAADRTDLYDENVNGLLRGAADGFDLATGDETFPNDGPTALYRLLRSDDAIENRGVLRAVLSPRYRTIDDFDVLLAMLKGLNQSGIDLTPDNFKADLTPRRMIVRVRAPQVEALAPELLKGYRSPYRSAGEESPIVFAGFRMTNSEVGGGAFSITPEITVLACDNGMTITKKATREVHLGGELPEGIQWSDETRRRNVELVASKTADTVRSFLSTGFLETTIKELEADAGVELADPAATITAVAKDKAMLFSDTEAAGILGMFVRGGQMTSGGVLHAVTAFSQTVPDADRAHDLETKAVRAMAIAARVAA